MRSLRRDRIPEQAGNAAAGANRAGGRAEPGGTDAHTGNLGLILASLIIATGASSSGADEYAAEAGLTTCVSGQGTFANEAGQWYAYGCTGTGREGAGPLTAPSVPGESTSEMCVFAYVGSAYDQGCRPIPANAITIDWIAGTASLNATVQGISGPTTVGITVALDQPAPSIAEIVSTYGYDGTQWVYGAALAGATAQGSLTPSSFVYIQGSQGGAVLGDGDASQTVGAAAAVGTSAATAGCGIC